MRRISWIAVGPLLSLAVLAGCGDTNVVSPMSAPAATAAAPVSLAPSERPTLDVSGLLADSASADFTVGPSGGVFFVGNNAVVFPERSVCDPAKSGYGPEVWDAPCATIQSPITIHAEVRRRDGKSWIDFTPSLRFAPSNNPGRWVWVVMSAPQAAGATGDLTRFNILYTSSIGGTAVDESAADPSLRTYVDTWSGTSLRRIKHFSGYVAPGGRCDSSCGEGGSNP